MSKEENVRLLVCLTCRSIDEVAFYDGPPGADRILEAATSRHRFLNDEIHELAPIFVVTVAAWKKNKKEISKSIWERTGEGLGAEHYNDIENFKKDAYQCWQSLQRPLRCADFHSDKKLLTPNTQEERKDAGLGKYKVSSPSKARYLCDFCICRSQVEREIGEAKNV